MENKKGQAAMEFLMTYGWAILVAIIVIGLLFYYYGASSGNKYIPTGTTTQSPFYTQGANIVAGGNITLALRNDAGETVNVTNLQATGDLTSCIFEKVSGTTAGSPVTINAGDTAAIAANCTSTVSSGKVARADLSISYQKISSAPGITLVTTGSLAEKVQ